MSEQEWSFSIDPTHVLKGGEVYDFEASADQCKALKQRFGVIAVEHAKAQFKAKPTQGGHVLHVAGTLQASGASLRGVRSAGGANYRGAF